MHPNLTKGFGMVGPKDFFPLLDFAYMPNNSLTPRWAALDTPAVKGPSAGLGAGSVFLSLLQPPYNLRVSACRFKESVTPLKLYGPSSVIGMWVFSWGEGP